MSAPTVYAPSAYPSVPRAPYNGYPGFAPVAPVESAAPYAPAASTAAAGLSSVAAPAEAPRNVLSIIAFVSSLIGFTGISVALGIIGLVQAKKNGERGRGFAIAAIIIGAVSLLIAIVITVALVGLYMLGWMMVEY